MRPLPLLAIAFSIGVLLAFGRIDPTATPLEIPRTAIAIAGLTLTLLALLHRRLRWHGVVLATLCLAAGALGAIDLTCAWRQLGDVLPSTPSSPAEAIEGTVAAPVVRVAGEVRILLELADGRRIEALAAEPGSLCPSDEGAATLLPGDRVRLRAPIVTPLGFRDPGATDRRSELAADGAFAIARATGGCGAIVRWAGGVDHGHGGLVLLRLAAQLRNRIERHLRRALPADRAALLAAFVAGDRGDVPRATLDAFRDAGASFLLGVGGLHLALVALLTFAAVRRLALRLPALCERVAADRPAAACAIVALLGDALVGGAGISTVRALAAAIAGLAVVALGRRRRTAEATALGLLVLVGPSPILLATRSFQLALAGVLGVSQLAPRLIPKRLAVWTGAAGTGRGKSGLRRVVRRVARAALWLIAANLGAYLAIVPLAACAHGGLSTGGLVGPMAIAPIVELWILPLGFAGAGSSFLPGRLGRRLGRFFLHRAGEGAALATTIASALARHAPRLDVATPSGVELAALYALLAGATLWWGRGVWSRAGRALALGGALVFGATLAIDALLTASSSDLAITFLDVGQGDAAIVELPGGEAWLVDGGGSFDPTFDPGALAVGPALAALGHRRIARVYLSHPHPDHMNGLATVIARFRPNAFLDASGDASDPGYARLLGALVATGVPHLAPGPGIFHGVSLEVLAPLDDSGRLAADPLAGPNDNSVVLRLGYAGRHILLAGDVEAAAERRLLATRAPQLPADVLKVPHHGSRTSSTAALLDAVRPRLALISCGRGNRFGFPAAEILARYRARGVRILRTDLDGAVRVSVGGDGALTARTAAGATFQPRRGERRGKRRWPRARSLVDRLVQRAVAWRCSLRSAAPGRSCRRRWSRTCRWRRSPHHSGDRTPACRAPPRRSRRCSRWGRYSPNRSARH